VRIVSRSVGTGENKCRTKLFLHAVEHGVISTGWRDASSPLSVGEGGRPLISGPGPGRVGESQVSGYWVVEAW
jgi:hypothetical protein